MSENHYHGNEPDLIRANRTRIDELHRKASEATSAYEAEMLYLEAYSLWKSWMTLHVSSPEDRIDDNGDEAKRERLSFDIDGKPSDLMIVAEVLHANGWELAGMST